MNNGVVGYMDLISMAQANSKSKQNELEKRQSQAAKDKKMDPKQVKLKVGVQKFLQKKEEEERQRKAAALRKKQQLLELRNQDRKATSRVRKMLNMTKSANKSCIADAKDSLNDSCNAQAAEPQPDEDDYGYTSTYAAEMYKKMLEKYQAAPTKPLLNGKRSHVDVPKIHSLKTSSSTKDKPGSFKESEPDHDYQDPVVVEKPKKKAPPPPPAFLDLLRLAEEKSKEPIMIKKPAVEAAEGQEFEFGRPMTAKEKARYASELALRQRVQASIAKTGLPTENPKPNESRVPPKTSLNTGRSKSVNVPKSKSTITKPIDTPSRPVERNHDRPELNNNNSIHRSQTNSHFGSQNIKDKPVVEPTVIPSPPRFKHPKVAPPSFKKPSHENNAFPQPSKSSLPTNGYSSPASPKHSTSYSKPRPYSEPEQRQKHPLKQPPQTVSQNSRNGQRPSHTPHEKPVSRHHSEMPPPFRKEKPCKRRAVIDSDEEEYDSEMDDFIDDSDVPGEDISSMIGQMFGYNKRKYANEDSDDEPMESSVEQQWQEERKTLQIGIREDQEEELREKRELEEKEKRRKASKKRKLDDRY